MARVIHSPHLETHPSAEEASKAIAGAFVVFRKATASVACEDMLHAAQTVPMTLPQASAVTTPFDDLEAVHALYEERIFRFLLYSTRDRDAAFSLTQDTFVKAWRTRASFRGDCSEVTWLMRIAVSLLRSHTRTESFRFWKKASASSVDVSDVELRAPAAGAERQLVTRAQLTEVWNAVDLLPAQQRTVFLLRFIEDMELPEIAAATGLALPTAKSHLYRALEKVRSLKTLNTPPRGSR